MLSIPRKFATNPPCSSKQLLIDLMIVDYKPADRRFSIINQQSQINNFPTSS
jgi:hypothetical protein